MMNLFEKAIEKKEILEFAIGKGKYHVVDRDYGNHSVIGSWINYILPLVESKGIDYVNVGIKNMFKELIHADMIDEDIRNENLLYHLHVYYYLANEKRIKALDLMELNGEIQKMLYLYINRLEQSNDCKADAVKSAISLIKSRGGLILIS